MGLKTQTPFGVRLTVGCSSLDIEGLLGVVHGLKIVMRKVEVFKIFGRHLGFDLRVDQLELIASGADEFGAGFWTHTDPVDGFGGIRVPLVSMATSKPIA